jgi:hypothetical protein
MGCDQAFAEAALAGAGAAEDERDLAKVGDIGLGSPPAEDLRTTTG